VRDLTTSSEAPIFKAPSNMPNKACVPRGSNGRPNTRHSRDESRAAHKETSPQAAHGPKPVAPQPPDSRLRQPEQKRSVFVEKHVWLNWLKPATSILSGCSRLGSDHSRRLTDGASLGAMLASILICRLPRSVKNLESRQNRRQATSLKRSSDSVCR
jgi:hypothetical protein